MQGLDRILGPLFQKMGEGVAAILEQEGLTNTVSSAGNGNGYAALPPAIDVPAEVGPPRETIVSVDMQPVIVDGKLVKMEVTERITKKGRRMFTGVYKGKSYGLRKDGPGFQVRNVPKADPETYPWDERHIKYMSALSTTESKRMGTVADELGLEHPGKLLYTMRACITAGFVATDSEAGGQHLTPAGAAFLKEQQASQRQARKQKKARQDAEPSQVADD